MEGFQWGGRGEDLGGKLQEIRSIIGRHKIDRERLRMVQETENSKNLNVQPMDMNYCGGIAGGKEGTSWRESKGKIGTTVIAQSIKYTLKN